MIEYFKFWLNYYLSQRNSPKFKSGGVINGGSCDNNCVINNSERVFKSHSSELVAIAKASKKLSKANGKDLDELAEAIKNFKI